MESIDAIYINRAFVSTMLTFITSVLLNNNNHSSPTFVTAFNLLPRLDIHLNFKNRITYNRHYNVIRLDCKETLNIGGHIMSTALPPIWINPNQDSEFSFQTGDSFDELEYQCVFYCLGLKGSFTAFQDTWPFEDEWCGGRHCIWMFNDDGLYSFNLKENKYHQKMSFKLIGVNNRAGNGTSIGRLVSFKPKCWQ